MFSSALVALDLSPAEEPILDCLPDLPGNCNGLLLVDLAHLFAATDFRMRHFVGTGTANFVHQFRLTGITTVTFACFSGHFLLLLKMMTRHVCEN